MRAALADGITVGEVADLIGMTTTGVRKIRDKHSPDRQEAAAVRTYGVSVGRDLTPDEATYLNALDHLPIWADRAHELREGDPAITLEALARASGITLRAVTHRLRRYPPRD